GPSLLLRLCLAAGLPVPLWVLAKCLKLHLLKAACSVLITIGAILHSPSSWLLPHGIPYHRKPSKRF
ncbi:hypothetical protein JOQ06_010851, partial [Pogonophryne albipinna]